MFGQQLLVDGPQGVELDIDGVDVEQRYAEFVGCGDGNRPRIRHLVIDEIGHQLLVGLAGGLGRFQDVLFRDNTVLYQAPW